MKSSARWFFAHAAALALGLPVAFAQDEEYAPPPEWRNTPITRSFENASVREVAGFIRERHGGALKLVMPPETDHLPPITIELHATPPAFAFAAMNQWLAGNDLRARWILTAPAGQPTATLDFAPPPVQPTDPPPPPRADLGAPPTHGIKWVGDLLDAETADPAARLVADIRSAFAKTQPGKTLDLRFNGELKLLLLNGTPAELRTVDDIIADLHLNNTEALKTLITGKPLPWLVMPTGHIVVVTNAKENPDTAGHFSVRVYQKSAGAKGGFQCVAQYHGERKSYAFKASLGDLDNDGRDEIFVDSYCQGDLVNGPSDHYILQQALSFDGKSVASAFAVASSVRNGPFPLPQPDAAAAESVQPIRLNLADGRSVVVTADHADGKATRSYTIRLYDRMANPAADPASAACLDTMLCERNSERLFSAEIVKSDDGGESLKIGTIIHDTGDQVQYDYFSCEGGKLKLTHTQRKLEPAEDDR